MRALESAKVERAEENGNEAEGFPLGPFPGEQDSGFDCLAESDHVGKDGALRERRAEGEQRACRCQPCSAPERSLAMGRRASSESPAVGADR
jgi:hypothetical protein